MVIDKICKMTVKGVQLKSECFLSITYGVLELWGKTPRDSALPIVLDRINIYSLNLFYLGPIDGQWSDWSSWSLCTHICGGGTRQRGRYCDSPEPRYGGSDCIGKNVELGPCGTEPCTGMNYIILTLLITLFSLFCMNYKNLMIIMVT